MQSFIFDEKGFLRGLYETSIKKEKFSFHFLKTHSTHTKTKKTIDALKMQNDPNARCTEDARS